MNKRLIHLFVLLLALVMPFQAFAMVNSCTFMGKVAHCEQMQQALQSAQSASSNSSMPDHCQMHANSHQKQTPQRADCCLGNACAAMCVGLIFPVSLSLLAFDATSDFTTFIAPRFNSQSVEGLERPPRIFS